MKYKVLQRRQYIDRLVTFFAFPNYNNIYIFIYGILLQSGDGQHLLEPLMVANSSPRKILVEILEHIHFA